ncbi:MAG: F0F1 ATP synthase subunit delta, partial [Candidatus Omnitrophica bacterium]|nr:F0F1 ATP synthase subunit delta [Candidatus Omnitrophota bacterium]
MLIASLILFQLIVFAALVVVLKRVLTKNIVSATGHLDELNQDYLKKEEDLKRRIEEAAQKSDEMIRKAEEEAGTIRKKSAEAARTESENMILHARAKGDEIMKQAEKSRQTLLEEMGQMITVGAIDKATELIQNTLPQKLREDAHAEWIADLMEEGLAQLKNVRLEQDVREIKVVSAFPLGDELYKALSKKLRSILGTDLPIKEEVDPQIVAGMVIH